jgi:hypothetical protein
MKIKKNIIIIIMVFLFIPIRVLSKESINPMILQIDDEKQLKKITELYTYVILYTYNKQNTVSDDIKTIEYFEKMILSEKQYSEKPYKLVLVDSNSNIQLYDFKNNEIGCIYNKKRIDSFKVSDYTSFESFEKKITDILNSSDVIKKNSNNKKNSKKKYGRKRRMSNDIISEDDDTIDDDTNNKKKNTKVIHTYSFPTVGASFGWGTPFYNWPGYWGAGMSPYWGGYYRRPWLYGGCGPHMGIGFGMSFHRHC